MTQSNTIPVACFAPPLSDETLAQYAALIGGLPAERAELADALRQCLACVQAWWALPESSLRGKRWQLRNTATGQDVEYLETPLEAAHIQALWDVTPWMRELLAIEPLFDAIPLGEKQLRDAAFHLLWHAKEITLDREPLTKDKLGV